jgi:hypothetical protein
MLKALLASVIPVLRNMRSLSNSFFSVFSVFFSVCDQAQQIFVLQKLSPIGLWHLSEGRSSLNDPIKHGGLENADIFLMSGAALWCILIPKDAKWWQPYQQKKTGVLFPNLGW